MKKILLLDNYDSFTYNLFHYLESLGAQITVFRNDEIDLEDVKHFDKIVLSPGPGIPDEAGILKPLIKEYASTKSILGICLGQQAIAEVFGGSLIRLNQVVHGVATPIEVTVHNEILYQDLPLTFEVGRYHSWVVNPQNLPDTLEITALDNNGNIMSLRHRNFDVRAVQFHPESIMTSFGKKMLENWLNK
jgi:anthranilate synthase component 2